MADNNLNDTYGVCILVLVADELVFDWDESNIAHISRHNVTPEEVEQVFANDPLDLGVDVVEDEERVWVIRIGYLREKGF